MTAKTRERKATLDLRTHMYKMCAFTNLATSPRRRPRGRQPLDVVVRAAVGRDGLEPSHHYPIVTCLSPGEPWSGIGAGGAPSAHSQRDSSPKTVIESQRLWPIFVRRP